MQSKIMLVFYGNDCLPYKDIERQVHYPIVGSAFLGASNTTKIRFYFDQIGNSNVTWVAVAKLPNGKQGSKVLSVSEDSELGENYAELQLDSWFTQAKGDVYIALQGYQGGVEYSYDSETELYEITGTPTIQTTGSIKLAINYAPIGQVADYNDEFTTYQEILAALGDKADISSTIIVVNDITQVVATTYEDKQLFYNLADRKLYQLDNSSFVVFQPYVAISSEPIPQSDFDIILAHKEYPILYGSYVFWYYGEDTTALRYARNDLDVSSNTFTTTKQQLIIFKNTREYDLLTQNAETYKKSKIDTELSGKQDTLVSGETIKTINNLTLLGSGNIEIESGTGGGAWGEITGDIQDQTDLQNEFQNVREVAEGKNKTLVIRYDTTAPTSDVSATIYKKADGTAFTNLADFNSYVSGLSIANASFNTQDNLLLSNYYIISDNLIVYRCNDMHSNFKVGDIVLIIQTDVPDRWFSFIYSAGAILSKLETTKVDLTNYATKTELADKSDLDLIAPEYDSSIGYAIGDLVIHDGKLYKCSTAITTAESWDSTHWTETDLDSDVVKLSGAQTVSGIKTFVSTISTNLVRPQSTGTYDLGTGSYKYKDLYLGGTAYVGTIKNNATISLDTIGTGGKVRPTIDGTDLGDSTHTWKDLYLSGSAYIGTNRIMPDGTNRIVFRNSGATNTFFFDGNSGLHLRTPRLTKLGESYGVNLPDPTGWTANKEIATTDYFGFKVIPAPSSTTLSDDEYNEIVNGNGVVINGTFLTKQDMIMLKPQNYSGTYYGAYFTTGRTQEYGCYQINSNSKYINIVSQTDGFIRLLSISQINGIPFANITNGIFNVINASDITNNTLTQAQYDLITNGKPTLISGTLLGYNNLFVLNMNTYTNGCFGNAICYKSGEEYKTFVLGIQISSSNVISITNTNYYNYCYYNNVASVNGKLLPSYPSSTGTFVLKCVDGVLTWVAE